MKNSLKISLKKVNFFDIEFLWHLRNQPDVYEYSKENRAVVWKEHINWIMPVILCLIPREIFIIQKSGIPVGQIRFDKINPKEVEISISLLKEFREKGVAVTALGLAIKRIKGLKKAKGLYAEIHKENQASIKLFEKLNFELKTKKGNWLRYVLKL